MPNDVPSLSQLSITAAYKPKMQEALQRKPDAEKSALIINNHFDAIASIFPEQLMFPKHLHESALVALKESYRTLVLQPYEKQLKQQQTQCLGYSAEDLESTRSTLLELKELQEASGALYWMARANDLQDIVSFFETKRKDCRMLFSTVTRDAVVSKLAKLGDQENIDKLLKLANDSSEDRISMLTSVIEGACNGGQTAILKNLFEEKCLIEEDKTHCQNYLTEQASSLLGSACASGNLASVEFMLERQPETEHKKIISEVHQGYRYHVLSEACRSKNSEVKIVNQLLKPFSQEEINRIFLPTLEETRKLPLPFPYTNVLAYGSVELNQHILTKVISPECLAKIVTSETFINPLTQSVVVGEEERSLGLLSQVPKQQFELVRRIVSLKLDKQGKEAVKQRFEKDCERLKSYLSVSTSRLTGHSQMFSEAGSSNTGNNSAGNRLRNSVLFSQSLEPLVDETERQKDKQRCQTSRLTKN